MNSVEFLPAWYPKRQRLRARLAIAACVAAVILVISLGVWLF